MDFPISPVVERTVSQARLTYKLREGFTKPFPQPITYMTMRDKFDNLLAQRAISAGATLIDGFKVNRIEQDDGYPRVFGDKDVVTGAVLVGADGANSVVAHQLGLLREAEIGVGLESEVSTEPKHLESWSSTVSLDFGTIRGGYMWVFPKEDHLSIGVASFVKFCAKIQSLLENYLHFLQLGNYRQMLTKGHRLPRRRKGMAIQSGRALLIGNAAGMIDFWTGEGIYYAIRSAQMAAPAVHDYLEGKTGDLQSYENTIDEQLMPELHVARTLTRIGVWFPKLAYTLMKNSDRAWNSGCQILRSERSYHDVRRRMGPFNFLFDLVGLGT